MALPKTCCIQSHLIQHPNADVHASTNAQKAMHTCHASRFQLMQQKENNIITFSSNFSLCCWCRSTSSRRLSWSPVSCCILSCSRWTCGCCCLSHVCKFVLQSLVPIFSSHNILVVAVVLLGGHLPISVVRHDAVIANIGVIVEGLLDIDVGVVAVLDAVRFDVIVALFIQTDCSICTCWHCSRWFCLCLLGLVCLVFVVSFIFIVLHFRELLMVSSQGDVF